MSRNSRTRAAAVVALALASAACDTGTVPDIPQEFDAQAAIQDYQAMESVLQSDDLSSFHALGARTPFGSAPAAIGAIADMQSFGIADGGRAYAGRLARRMLSARTETSDGPAAGPIISGWHRGSTFVYDPEVDEYRPDLTLEGAPETGVRFILYEVDEEGTPILDAEVGYADLIDEGDGSVEDIVLRLQVVLNGVTRLEYRITLDHDATSGALTVDGFLVGEEATLDFAVTLAASNVDGVEQGELTFDFGVEERGFSVVGRVSGIEENDDGSGSVELDIRHGNHRLQVSVTSENGVLDGTVSLNGEAFATITGPAEDPVIADAGGEPLTLSELQALHRAVHVVGHVFKFVEDVLDPVDEIVLLGFIL